MRAHQGYLYLGLSLMFPCGLISLLQSGSNDMSFVQTLFEVAQRFAPRKALRLTDRIFTYEQLTDAA